MASRSIAVGLAVGLCLAACRGTAGSVPSWLEVAWGGGSSGARGLRCIPGGAVGLDAAGGRCRSRCGVPAVPRFPGMPLAGAVQRVFRHVSQSFAAIARFAALLSGLGLPVAF